MCICIIFKSYEIASVSKHNCEKILLECRTCVYLRAGGWGGGGDEHDENKEHTINIQ